MYKRQIKEWIERHFIELKEASESTTRHGKLLKVDPVVVVGRYLYPRFTFTTGDSMGMNTVSYTHLSIRTSIHHIIACYYLIYGITSGQ